MLVFVASVALPHVDLRYQEHVNKCPDEPEDAAPDDNKELCVEGEWASTGATCRGLEMGFKVVGSHDHVVVEN